MSKNITSWFLAKKQYWNKRVLKLQKIIFVWRRGRGGGGYRINFSPTSCQFPWRYGNYSASQNLFAIITYPCRYDRYDTETQSQFSCFDVDLRKNLFFSNLNRERALKRASSHRREIFPFPQIESKRNHQFNKKNRNKRKSVTEIAGKYREYV